MENLHALGWSRALESILCKGSESSEDIEAIRMPLRRFIWKQTWDSLLLQLHYVQTGENRSYHPGVASSNVGESSMFNSQSTPNTSESSLLSEEVKTLPQHPFVQSRTPTIWQLHAEHQRIEERIGPTAFERAVARRRGLTDEQRELVRNCMKYLDGADVYWDGAVEAFRKRSVSASASIRDLRRSSQESLQQGLDSVVSSNSDRYLGARTEPRVTKETTSRSRFGRLRVTPFPFSAVLKFDDCDDFAVFTLESEQNESIILGQESSHLSILRDLRSDTQDLRQLLRLNCEDPKVTKWRKTRAVLRMLDDRVLSVGGRRGRLRINDSKDFLFNFDMNGYPSDNPTDRKGSCGFVCRFLSLRPTWSFNPCSGGRGEEEIFHLELHKAEDFDEEGNLLLSTLCKQVSLQEWTRVRLVSNRLRGQALHELDARHRLLPFDFHVDVYGNCDLSFKEVCDVLETYGDASPLLSWLVMVSDHQNQLLQLCNVMSFLRACSPIRLLWYLFWFDIYNSNSKLSTSSKFVMDAFDPCAATSVGLQSELLRDDDYHLSSFFDNMGLPGSEEHLIAFLPMDRLRRRLHRLNMSFGSEDVGPFPLTTNGAVVRVGKRNSTSSLDMFELTM